MIALKEERFEPGARLTLRDPVARGPASISLPKIAERSRLAWAVGATTRSGILANSIVSSRHHSEPPVGISVRVCVRVCERVSECVG